MAISTTWTAVAIMALWCSSQETAGFKKYVPGGGETNLALKKPASQSSTSMGSLGSASNSVDGQPQVHIRDGSCSVTSTQVGAHWLMVDLQGVYTVRSVRITPRHDCCWGSLKDFTVGVSTEKPSTLPGFPGRTSAPACVTIHREVPLIAHFPYECDAPVTGRYVRVVKESPSTSSYLTMCEFGVFENNIVVHYPVPETTNLALERPARQSSTLEDYAADRAVDGNTDGNAKDGSCARTEQGEFHWWMVDLEDSHLIKTIRITNRNDYAPNRLRNFVIEVSEEDPSGLEGFPGRTISAVCVARSDDEPVPFPVPVNFECDQSVRGRYVRVVKETGHSLQLCEFEVYEPPKTSKFDHGKNGPWAFRHVKSHGFHKTHRSMSEQRYLLDCARRRLRDKKNMMAAPYIQIDLQVGACRFLQNVGDSKISISSKWTVYDLVGN